MSLGGRLQASAARVEAWFDAGRFAVRRRLRTVRPNVIVPFRGFGTIESLYLSGRVLEKRRYHTAPTPGSKMGRLRFMYQRFQSDEVPFARVAASYAGTDVEVRCDEEGFFDCVINPADPLPVDRVWHDVILELPDADEEVEPVVGRVEVPPVEAEFGVISDIDDTIVRTSATNLWKMVRTTLLNSPESRLPFPGVAAFYLALQRGATESGHNPLFYVSSSPWNLYDVIESFMDVHGIPFGPILLRDFGLSRSQLFAASHRRHKREQIERILETYPQLPFILIGDSGQHDPEIYADLVRDFTERIHAVYIRDVGILAGRTRTREAARVVREHGIEMLLVPDTEAAAIHAADRGLISPGALADIRAEKAKDVEAPNDLAQLLGIKNDKLSR